jgi:hypothetical protein
VSEVRTACITSSASPTIFTAGGIKKRKRGVGFYFRGNLFFPIPVRLKIYRLYRGLYSGKFCIAQTTFFLIFTTGLDEFEERLSRPLIFSHIRPLALLTVEESDHNSPALLPVLTI